MSFTTGLSAEDLRDLARRAVADFMQNGTGLSQAVVKCASAYGGPPLTAEHVRRICEMTYHEAYDRLYKSSPGPDRWVSFDPPDPVFCAEALRSQKVASLPHQETRMTSTTDMAKTASAPARQKFTPRNSWDIAMERVPTKLASDERWANPDGDVIRARQRLRAAVDELEAQAASIETAEKIATLKLQAQAERVIRDEGLDAGTVLQACVRDDCDGIPVKVASDVLCSLSRYLDKRGFAMPEKVAAVHITVNPAHPLPRSFQEVANLRTEKLAVAEALEEMRGELARLNRGLRAIN